MVGGTVKVEGAEFVGPSAGNDGQAIVTGGTQAAFGQAGGLLLNAWDEGLRPYVNVVTGAAMG